MELATTTAIATDTDPATPGIQLPTTLGGTTVSVKDSLGTARPASLFYAGPTQINYLIPDGTAAGAADVTITNGTGGISIGKANVAAVQPGIFSVTSDGTGIASAQIQRVAGAVQTFEATAQFTGGVWTAIPIDWKNATDDLYLVLYGTGVRNRSALSNVTATIGGGTALPTVSKQRSQAALDELFRQVLAWGGAITGEHGIGIAKKRWWPLAVPKPARDLHRTVKRALDPKGILNPGKFV